MCMGMDECVIYFDGRLEERRGGWKVPWVGGWIHWLLRCDLICVGHVLNCLLFFIPLRELCGCCLCLNGIILLDCIFVGEILVNAVECFFSIEMRGQN